MFLTKLSMFKRNRFSFINFNKMGISNGKPELNIRKIETLREYDRFAGVTPKKEPTKGVSGATKFHEKFRKSKRNGNK